MHNGEKLTKISKQYLCSPNHNNLGNTKRKFWRLNFGVLLCRWIWKPLPNPFHYHFLCKFIHVLLNYQYAMQGYFFISLQNDGNSIHSNSTCNQARLLWHFAIFPMLLLLDFFSNLKQHGCDPKYCTCKASNPFAGNFQSLLHKTTKRFKYKHQFRRELDEQGLSQALVPSSYVFHWTEGPLRDLNTSLGRQPPWNRHIVGFEVLSSLFQVGVIHRRDHILQEARC